MTTLAALKCHVRKPTTSVLRIGCKFYELFHPEEPWMAQGAICFCDVSLIPSDGRL
jgi:hypothetical protein